MISTYLFDLDGTIIDEKIYSEIYDEILDAIIGRLGIDGMKLNKEITKVKKDSGRVDTFDLCESLECVDIYYDVLQAKADNICVDEDTSKLFKALKSMGKRIGMLSNSRKKTIEMFLQVYSITEFVDFIFSGDDYKKENDDYFDILRVEQDINPDECMVIENKESMIDLAKEAGFHTILVRKKIKYDMLKYL